MATVIVNSGPVDAMDKFSLVPKEKWRSLMWVKRDFLKTRIKHDCRCLLEFVHEAEGTWEELEFKSAEDMIRNGFELDPQEVDFALAWLELKDPQEATPFKDAVKEGRKLRDGPGAPEGNKNALKEGKQLLSDNNCAVHPRTWGAGEIIEKDRIGLFDKTFE